MIFTLIVLVVVITVLISQAAQGFFGALIMTVLTACCAMASLGVHEWVANQWLAPLWKPEYAMPLALAATFGVSLVMLRLVFDHLIRRACLLPAWIDRIGGGICGAVTSLTMTGMLVLCLRMIPFEDGNILGYAWITPLRPDAVDAASAPPTEDAPPRELLLRPDRFAAGLATVASGGLFSASGRFDAAYPDFVEAVSWVSAVPAAVSRYAPPNSISVVETVPVDFVFRMTPGDPRSGARPTYEPQRPPSDRHFRVVRVALRAEARDERKSHLFTLRQFRLVGRMPGRGLPRQFHPIAIQQEDTGDPQNRHVRLIKHGQHFWPVTDIVFSPRDGDNQVEVVFELPNGFMPAFLEYKRQARAAVTFREDTDRRVATTPDERRTSPEMPDRSLGDSRAAEPGPEGRRARRRRSPEEPPPPPRGPATPDDQNGTERRPRDRVRGVAASTGPSRFGDELPIALAAYRRVGDAEISRGTLRYGHLSGEVDSQSDQAGPPVTRFEVPDEQRLLHLAVDPLHARSLFGRALGRAVQVVQNYFVQDERGRQYKLDGKYAIADVGGRKVIEIQYFPEPVGSLGGMGSFQQIHEDRLGADDQYVLLFLVDPGARIVSFSTGGAATRRDDLRDQNLVAPP